MQFNAPGEAEERKLPFLTWKRMAQNHWTLTKQLNDDHTRNVDRSPESLRQDVDRWPPCETVEKWGTRKNVHLAQVLPVQQKSKSV
jgi:hypothetical protein